MLHRFFNARCWYPGSWLWMTNRYISKVRTRFIPRTRFVSHSLILISIITSTWLTVSFLDWCPAWVFCMATLSDGAATIIADYVWSHTDPLVSSRFMQHEIEPVTNHAVATVHVTSCHHVHIAGSWKDEEGAPSQPNSIPINVMHARGIRRQRREQALSREHSTRLPYCLIYIIYVVLAVHANGVTFVVLSTSHVIERYSETNSSNQASWLKQSS